MENGLEPDAVDAQSGEALEVAFGIGIEFRFQKRITVEREVGITKTRGGVFRRRGASVFGFRGSGEVRNELEERFGVGESEGVGRERSERGGDFAGAGGGGFGRFFVAERITLWFERAELDVEEIIFTKHVGHVFGGPVEELEELLVGEEMPVAADDGDVGTALLLSGNGSGRGYAHGLAEGADLVGRGVEDGGHFFERDEGPIAPDESVEAVGEMRERDGSGSGAGGKRGRQIGGEGGELGEGQGGSEDAGGFEEGASR